VSEILDSKIAVEKIVEKKQLLQKLKFELKNLAN
jgi:hypothetical protein